MFDFGIKDIIDIIAVALGLYYIYRVMKASRSLNVFGGITSCVSVAEGIVAAVSSLGESFTKPIVVRLDGNQAEAGRAILAEANLPQVTIAETMDGAADRVTAIAQELGEN